MCFESGIDSCTDWEKNRVLNAEILIELCGGNIFDTISVAKKYGGIKVNVSVKTLERMAVRKMADAGLTMKAISNALELPITRVKRIITKEVERGK